MMLRAIVLFRIFGIDGSEPFNDLQSSQIVLPYKHRWDIGKIGRWVPVSFKPILRSEFRTRRSILLGFLWPPIINLAEGISLARTFGQGHRPFYR